MTLENLTLRELFVAGMAFTSDDAQARICFSRKRHYRNRWWTHFFSTSRRGMVRLNGEYRKCDELYQLRVAYIDEVYRRLDQHRISAYTVETYGPDNCRDILDIKPAASV